MAKHGPGARAEPPAPAPAVGYVRSFNRFEFKYLLRGDQIQDLIDDLEGYAHPDPHSGEEGYRVHSIYWDSPELLFFWEKVDGEKFRRKLRFRTYGGRNGSAHAFVEIKQRVNATVQKRRILWPVERIRSVFGETGIDAQQESGVRDRVAMEALFLCRCHGLEPKMAVGYRRRAFFGSHESDLRITFDTRLQYDAQALRMGEVFETGKYMLDENLAVMELKFNDRIPLWLLELVKRHGIDRVRMSKYCAAVDREFYGGRNT